MKKLFSNGPHLATNQFELGDLSLGNEIATGGEVSVRYRKDQTHVSFNVFATNYSDYIYERATGSGQDGLPEFRFTAADVHFTGFEIEVGAKLASLGDFDLLGDASAQDDIAPSELVTKSCTLVNLQASYRINERLSLRGRINNLFDQDARQHTSFLKEVVPLPGRNFKMSLSAKF